jgi:hypothetical protein
VGVSIESACANDGRSLGDSVADILGGMGLTGESVGGWTGVSVRLAGEAVGRRVGDIDDLAGIRVGLVNGDMVAGVSRVGAGRITIDIVVGEGVGLVNGDMVAGASKVGAGRITIVFKGDAVVSWIRIIAIIGGATGITGAAVGGFGVIITMTGVVVGGFGTIIMPGARGLG